MADMTSAQGCTSFLCAVRLGITLVETTLLLGRVRAEGLSVAHNFAGGQNDGQQVKTVFATSQTLEISVTA